MPVPNIAANCWCEPTADSPQSPQALTVVGYERVLPEIKYLGEIANTWYLREAVAAVFVDHPGRFSEATIWNLVFRDGETVVWPRVTMLTGATLGSLGGDIDLQDPPRVQSLRCDANPLTCGLISSRKVSAGIS